MAKKVTPIAAIAAFPHELVHHLAARALGLQSTMVAGATLVDIETDAQELLIALAPLTCTLLLVAAGAYLLPMLPGQTALTQAVFWLVSAGWVAGCAHDVAQAAATLRRMLA